MYGSSGPSSSSDCAAGLGEQHLVDGGIDRRRREQPQLQRLELRVAEPLQPLGVRLLHLLDVPDERQR